MKLQLKKEIAILLSQRGPIHALADCWLPNWLEIKLEVYKSFRN